MSSIPQEMGMEIGSVRIGQLAKHIKPEVEEIVNHWLEAARGQEDFGIYLNAIGNVAETYLATGILKAIEIMAKDHCFTKKQADESIARYLQKQNLISESHSQEHTH